VPYELIEGGGESRVLSGWVFRKMLLDWDGRKINFFIFFCG
jgi:hypothetical protein